jgi:hypothetical protein
MNDLYQLIEIAKLGHALAASVNVKDNPNAKDFKNKLLVRLSKLPSHLKCEIHNDPIVEDE